MKRFLFLTAAVVLSVLSSCNKEDELSSIPITVTFTVSPAEPIAGSPATFTVDVKGGRFPFTYEWDFGDGLTGSKYTETVVYELSGEKTVSLKLTDTNGATGFVSQTIVVNDPDVVPRVEKPNPKAVKITDRTLTFQWAITEEEANDGTYQFELLEGATVVNKDCKQGKFTAGGIMTFGGLKPATEYVFRLMRPANVEVETTPDEEAKVDSEWAEVTVTTEAAPAAVPDAIICERFDNFIWGSDYFLGGYGIRATDEAGATSLDVPAGTFANGSTGSYFATFKETFRNNTNTLAGWSGAQVYGHPGVAKLGSGSNYGMIETPAFGTAGNYTVTFDIAPYPGDNAVVNLTVSGGGTLVGETTLDLTGWETGVWTNKSVSIVGATAETKFRMASENASNKRRYALDNIIIAPSSASTPVLGVEPEGYVYGDTGGSHSFTISSNTSWKAVASESWITVEPSSGQVGSTQVSISVPANELSRSGTVTFSTTSGAAAEAQTVINISQQAKEPLSTPVYLTHEATHNSLFFRWDDVENTTKFRFELVKKSSQTTPVNGVTENDFKNNYNYKPAVVLGNLEPSTDYIFKVKALATDDLHADSEYLNYEFSTPAVPDESGYIFCERFDNLVWGSDYLRSAWGFRPSTERSAAATSLSEPVTEIVKPKDQINYLYTTDSNTATGFSATFLSEQVGLAGWSGQRVHGMFGMIKLGNWKSTDDFVLLPALSAIEGTQDVKLSFDYVPWWDEGGSSTDSGSISIEIVGAGTAAQTKFTNTFSPFSPMATATTTISGATSATQIKIISDVSENGHRVFVDNIIVEKL